MQPQIRTFEQQVSSATIWRLFSPEDSVTVHLNMREQGNGQLPLAKRTVRNRDSSGLWEQIKTAYASGIGLREIARNMGIPAGTVLARANREVGHGSATMPKLSPNATTRRRQSLRSKPPARQCNNAASVT